MQHTAQTSNQNGEIFFDTCSVETDWGPKEKCVLCLIIAENMRQSRSKASEYVQLQENPLRLYVTCMFGLFRAVIQLGESQSIGYGTQVFRVRARYSAAPIHKSQDMSPLEPRPKSYTYMHTQTEKRQGSIRQQRPHMQIQAVARWAWAISECQRFGTSHWVGQIVLHRYRI